MNLRKDHYRVSVRSRPATESRNLDMTVADRRSADGHGRARKVRAGFGKLRTVTRLRCCGVPVPFGCRICRAGRAANGWLRSVRAATVQRTDSFSQSVAPRADFFVSLSTVDLTCARSSSRRTTTPFIPRQNNNITLSGGSLGSCVDEERSQLREVM